MNTANAVVVIFNYYLIFVLNCISGSYENYPSQSSKLSQLHLLMLLFIQTLSGNCCTSSNVSTVHSYSKFCLLYWTAPCWQAGPWAAMH